MECVLKWLANALSDGSTGAPSIKRLGFFLVVCCMTSLFAGVLLGMIGLSLSWLPAKESLAGMKIVADLFGQLMFWAIGAVTTGYIGGKAVEKIPTKKGKDNGISPTEPPEQGRD